MRKFLQVIPYPNSAHTRKYNEIKPWHRRNTRVTEEEVERAIKRTKRHKAQGVDGITSDIIKLGGPIVLTYLTNIFNNILEAKQIPDSWHEANIVILFKKGDPKDIKNFRPISLLSHSYKIFTRLLQTRIERTLDENQPREQAGFRKGYSTTDHLQALNQIIEKSNKYNLPLCIGFIDYEKAFDTVEHFAIFEALRKTNVNETYINILQNIYNQATARVHLDKLVSTEFPVHRGVRQGDPLSPKLFTAVMEEVFKKEDISETNLRFAENVALFNNCLFVGCLTSQQQASVSQGRICTDNFTCCHTEIEVADPTFYLTQSQYTDTGPTSPSTDPITPGARQGSHWSANFEVTGMTRP